MDHGGNDRAREVRVKRGEGRGKVERRGGVIDRQGEG